MIGRLPLRPGIGRALAVFLLLALLLAGTADAATRIVPIGDSLTHGGGTTDDGGVHPTYRYWLWEKLNDNGYDVDFVGSMNSPSFSGYSFDRGNEGHGGYRIGDLVDGIGEGKLSSWLSGYYPDVALVLIGTNDVLWDTPMEKRFSNLGRLVETLRDRNPHIAIFLAKLPPTGDPERNDIQGLIEFNSRLPGWASGESTSSSPIRVVDLYSGYDGRDRQPGGSRYIHPDESGEKKIANRFYSALASYLDKGAAPETTTPTPTETPTPTPTETPTPTPTPTETPDPDADRDTDRDADAHTHPDAPAGRGHHRERDPDARPGHGRARRNHHVRVRKTVRHRQPGLVPRLPVRNQRDRDELRRVEVHDDRGDAEAREPRLRHHAAGRQVRPLVPGRPMGRRHPLTPFLCRAPAPSLLFRRASPDDRGPASSGSTCPGLSHSQTNPSRSSIRREVPVCQCRRIYRVRLGYERAPPGATDPLSWPIGRAPCRSSVRAATTAAREMSGLEKTMYHASSGPGRFRALAPAVLTAGAPPARSP